MPTDQEALAARRTIRFALGSSLSLFVSQLSPSSFSYLAAVFTAMFLALPLPAPRLSGALRLLLTLAGALLLGFLVLGPLRQQPAAGLLLLGAAYFAVFRYAALGGNALLVTLAVAGLGAIPIVGSVSLAAAGAVAVGLMQAAALGVAILWIAHALLPDPPLPSPPALQKPATADSPLRLAFRSTLVVMPVMTWLLATSGTSNVGMAIKVASMGQQATADASRQAGLALLASTAIGGAGAVAVWLALKIWPSLLLYTLLVLLVGLLMGRRIFLGAGLAPTGPLWSYGFVTMLIILGPIVLDSGDGAAGRFLDRLLMFFWASVYSLVAVLAFDQLIGTRAVTEAPQARSHARAPPQQTRAGPSN